MRPTSKKALTFLCWGLGDDQQAPRTQACVRRINVLSVNKACAQDTHFYVHTVSGTHEYETKSIQKPLQASL